MTETDFPGAPVPLVDEHGFITDAWFFFLQTLWERTGSAAGSTALVFDVSTVVEGLVRENQQVTPKQILALVDGLLGSRESIPKAAPFAPTLGASPGTIEAARAGQLLVDGGTVSAVEFSRDGGSTTFDVGVQAGAFAMLTGDQIIITYSSAPTVTFIPMD